MRNGVEGEAWLGKGWGGGMRKGRKRRKGRHE